MKATSYTFVLNEDQQRKVIDLLTNGNYRPQEVPHTLIAAARENCRINLYKSGKLVVQGKAAEEWVLFTLEPEIMLEAVAGYEAELNPEALEPHIGIDESGKGDFFGPLVIAAAYTDRKLAEQLQELGVRDSKRISSDKKALMLARDIRKILNGKFAIVSIGPEAYNRMYAKIGNLNRLLAWGHARAIENALEKVPDCPRALSDKFGPSNRIESALMKNGRKIKLEQKTKAESDIAVAAASILARAGFLDGLRKLEQTAGVEIPKGASAKVRETAVEIVRKHGPQMLKRCAKCHFKTADAVLEAAGFSRNDLKEGE